VEKIRRLLSWREDAPSPPYRIHFFPTERCNLHCFYCTSANNGFYRRELPPERLLQLVDEAADLGVREWRISGTGEPTLHPGCFPMMYHIKERGMSGTLVTNGTLFSDGAARRLVELGWDEIWLSLDGGDAQTHDFHRGRGTFSKAERLLSTLHAVKNELGVTLPRVYILAVLTARNASSVASFFQLAERFGCDNVVFNELEVRTVKAREQALDPRSRKFFLQGLSAWQEHPRWAMAAVNVTGLRHTAEKASRQSKGGLFPFFGRPRKSNRLQNPPQDFLDYSCFEPWYSMQIYPDGRVAFCCVSYLEDYAPNCREEALGSIWDGFYLTEARRRIAAGDTLAACRPCNAGQQNEILRLRENLVRAAAGCQNEK